MCECLTCKCGRVESDTGDGGGCCNGGGGGNSVMREERVQWGGHVE